MSCKACLLPVVIVALVVTIATGQVAMSGLEVSFHYMTLTIKDSDTGDVKLVADIGVGHSWPDKKHNDFVPCKSYESDVCLENDVARFDLERKGQCFTVTWTPLSRDFIPTDCLPLKDAFWYGGAEVYTQYWPINEQKNAMASYVSGDLIDGPYYGSVLERYWLSSAGLAVHVDNEIPLHVSWNADEDARFCMKAAYEGPHYQNHEDKLPQLRYTICEASDVKAAHLMLHPDKYKKPSQLPDLRMLKSPIWSTWARYKMHVTEEDVLELATEIKQHGFSNSQLEIDDKYTPSYGEISFDTVKFPSGRGLVDKLHDMGFRVTSWVTPFVNLESPLFEVGMNEGYFIKDGLGKVPALVKWWQGIGGAIDVTNPDAVAWYSSRLQAFQNETGVDSFKFDAGENNWFPPSISTYEPLENPNDYTSLYVALLAQFGGMVEARVGYRSQEHPIFVRMMDKDSVWSHDNGLRTMIPNALLMSVLGYHYCLPDMIGGNGYSPGILGLASSELPSKELFIRWTQVSAYLTSMQFSFVPWQYDEETVDIAQEMVRVHEEVVYPLVLEAAEEMIKSGTPIIRPLWWHDPTDAVALTCDSEFLVGESLLVAPVLHDGARHRDVYLPRGRWQDALRGGDLLQGPTWMRDYRVELNEVATFWLDLDDKEKEEL